MGEYLERLDDTLHDTLADITNDLDDILLNLGVALGALNFEPIDEDSINSVREDLEHAVRDVVDLKRKLE